MRSTRDLSSVSCPFFRAVGTSEMKTSPVERRDERVLWRAASEVEKAGYGVRERRGPNEALSQVLSAGSAPDPSSFPSRTARRTLTGTTLSFSLPG